VDSKSQGLNVSLHLDILPKAQRQLWSELYQVPKEFTLYGGTAIALQLGHRQSVDFDFFGNRPFDPTKLQAKIPFLAGAQIRQREENTLTAILHREDQVAVSFFGVPNLPRLMSPLVSEDNGLKIASLLDLAGTKASVVQLRAEAKDYLDLDMLVTKGGISLPTALAAGQALYGVSFNPQITLKALSYFEDGDLRTLPEESKSRLATAARCVDLDHLPTLNDLIRGRGEDLGLGL
jgi:Nucleotidyl transferase AbiEii toxin, Type IV TA system